MPEFSVRMIAGASAIAMSVFSQAPEPGPQRFVFTTASARYVIESSGLSSVEVRTDRRQLRTDDYPFAVLKTASAVTPASRVVQSGATLTATFGSTGIEADFLVRSRSDYFAVEVAAIRGGPVDELCFAQLKPAGLPTAGNLLAVRWSEDFAVSLMSLRADLESRLGPDQTIVACAHASLGTLVGERVALIAAPTNEYLNSVRQVERDYSLPSPAIDGEWAKRSTDARTSYLFVDMDEANVDEVIRYARLGGFKYILVYSSTWSSSLGSYPVNTRHFPHGEEGLRRVIEKCHRAGIKVGMHMLTSLIDKRDPLAHSVPLSGLLRDAEATLTASIDESASVVHVTGLSWAPASGPPDATGSDIQIDNELLHCKPAGGNAFGDCIRGFEATSRAPHPAGAPVNRLVVREGAYLADLKGPLKDIIAERIARLINDCGFDMIYFDGGELNSANGPSWYWVGVQQESIWRRLHRPVLVQGSGWTQWSWHFFTRGTCDDFASIGTRPYLDLHKIADYRELHRRNFMPAELGWVRYAKNAPSHPPTLPEDIEYLAVRMLALDAGAGIETTLNDLKGNGRTEEALRLFGQYEALRLARRLPETARAGLQQGAWHLASNGTQETMQAIERTVVTADVPGEVEIENRFNRQALKFRAEVEPVLGAAGDPANLLLLGQPITVRAPAATEPMPGALAERIEFAHTPQPLDLRHHRTLAVTLRVDGFHPAAQVSTINIQLQNGINYRDHYVDLDFNGEKTILLREPDAERMLGELRPDPRNYAFKAALRDFSYQSVSSVNVRWMRVAATATSRCSITRIEALAEADIPLSHVEIGIGSTTIVLPTPLAPGAYVESSGDGVVRWFDANGHALGTAALASPPPDLAPGRNTLTLKASEPGAIKVSVWTSGGEIDITSPPAKILRLKGSRPRGRSLPRRRLSAVWRRTSRAHPHRKPGFGP
jgi:hypothetical protein